MLNAPSGFSPVQLIVNWQNATTWVAKNMLNAMPLETVN
jgi:hypothetical protein